jgi:GMP synthase (glutamine-hydrolysing)
MKLHIVVHESFESPAAINVWARSKNHEIGYSRLYRNEKLPDDVDGFDFLIVMGGPQSPATTMAECAHFDAKKEITLIEKAIDHGKLVLGVCLGAQLVGEALGARFAHSPNREIGVFELALTESGKRDSVFSSFPERFLVGHWHGDMPGLTDDAEILAYSEGCPRQVIRYTPRVYGFQCHFEFTPEAIEGMIENSSEELDRYGSLPYVQNAATLRSNDYEIMNRYLFKFLDHMESIQRD